MTAISYTDVLRIAALRKNERSFDSLTAAMAYALHSLGEYQRGACR